MYTRTWRGRLVASIWPRKRKARRTLTQREREEMLRSMVLAIKYTNPETVSHAIDTFKKSRILYRDWLFSVMYGSAIWNLTLDGRPFYPDQFRIAVSKALDELRPQRPGIPARHARHWHILPFGPAGTVLTSQGPGQPPTWA
jgi:hypothetical protein